MLLQLPTELIQLVLRNCDTPAYFQAAFSSRRLYEIASGSREVIIHQLQDTPGWNDGIDVHQTRHLFGELMRRSSEHLGGAEHSANPTYEYQNRVIDYHASTIEASENGIRALLVFKGHSTVLLVNRSDGDRTEVQLKSPGQDIGEVEIIQTAFDGYHGVYVLHRFKPFLDQDLDTDHPFVKHALESCPNGSIHLAYHHLNLRANTIRMYDFPESRDYRPLAFSVANGKFAVSWQSMLDPFDHEVVLYAQLYDENDDDYVDGDEYENEDGLSERVMEEGKEDNPYATLEAYVLTSSNDQDPDVRFSRRAGPAMRLTFNDRGFQLLYHYRAQTIYGAFQRLDRLPSPPGEPRPHVNRNACNVQFSPFLSLQFSIGIPFFGTHKLGDINQGERCHWQYLAFGIATHRVEKWTVACLLKSESFTGPRCTHVLNLDRGRRFDSWQIMAQLGGFREVTTSHGSPVATSRRGTRVAVATWKTLYIWALNPSELIEDNINGFYPSSWESSTGAIELRPVILQLEAVCSQLCFTEKEDELVAITDRGVMFLNIGYYGK
ncbi:hypothetical protein PDIG_22470 [Penicillium digitatum PHI26]|uniref:F-box domain-containing protein n=2 Tax=Penicillium digitatum TaxID=36651 RepID=K9G4S4_PEND2|nr:hypothetical protein PDIP_14860 [Penicillium digitatum Pd1]EKV15892.1 hypothetical protein PDIG_22470 [Penicillium digitatum PHI26]EKV20562.1 hypothetical protein PDIP_14860 [Penicillium digitatum Pd1]